MVQASLVALMGVISGAAAVRNLQVGPFVPNVVLTENTQAGSGPYSAVSSPNSQTPFATDTDITSPIVSTLPSPDTPSLPLPAPPPTYNSPSSSGVNPAAPTTAPSSASSSRSSPRTASSSSPTAPPTAPATPTASPRRLTPMPPCTRRVSTGSPRSREPPATTRPWTPPASPWRARAAAARRRTRLSTKTRGSRRLGSSTRA